jgi:hypothetical protein
VKKAILVALILGLIAGSFAAPAEAKKKKKKKPQRIERTAEGSYDAPTLVIAGTCTQTGAIGCVAIPTGIGEHYVTATVTDSHGQPVYVSVQADMDGNNQDDTTYGSFCGETTEPILVDEGTELHFWVGLSPDPGFAGCVPGEATSGTLSATFSNLP